ncbi:MAG: hypothetical protein HON94_15995, partial [Methylococcales bacterium]|nr:hypothetical protein [Methylococcales bacterium]
YHIFEPHHKDSIFGYYYFKCSKLGNDNLCTIHDNRPTICAKYPEPEMIRDGGELLPGCGYHAVPKIEFSEILDKELK